MIWNVIKSWIDPRTAGKVEMYGSRRKRWEKRLLELADPSELPADYGGKAEDTMVTLVKETKEEGVVRQYTEFMSVKSSGTTPTYELGEGETMEISVFTRSMVEGMFYVMRSGPTASKNNSRQQVKVKHLGAGTEDEEPTCVKFPRVIKGPTKVRKYTEVQR